MSLPPLASTDDLATWLGRAAFTGTDSDRADTVVAQASTAVRVEAGQNWVNSTGDELEGVPLGIPEIVVQVAARMWANPTGAKSTTTGPFSAQLGALDLTDGEKAAIRRAVSGTVDTNPALWVLGVSRDEFETGTVYLNVTPPGEKIPYLADRDIV